MLGRKCASFSCCLLNDIGPIFRTSVPASFWYPWPAPSDGTPCSERSHSWLNALLWPSWNPGRDPTNYVAYHDFRWISLGSKFIKASSGEIGCQVSSFKSPLRNCLLQVGLLWCPFSIPISLCSLKSCFIPALPPNRNSPGLALADLSHKSAGLQRPHLLCWPLYLRRPRAILYVRNMRQGALSMSASQGFLKNSKAFKSLEIYLNIHWLKHRRNKT